MAVLTADRKSNLQSPGEVEEYPMQAAEICYLGGLTFLDAAGRAGATPTEQFVGVCDAQADNSAGAAGAIRVRVRRFGVVDFVAAGLVLGDAGKTLYAVDDQLVQLAPNGHPVGTLEKFTTATEARLRFGPKLEAGAGDSFIMVFHGAGAITDTLRTVMNAFEFPRPVIIERMYATAVTAPGAGEQCDIIITDGTTPKTVSIVGAATDGEDEAVNQRYEEDVDMAITMKDTAVGGATADVTLVVTGRYVY